MEVPPIKQPFSNLQLELLSLYSRNISDEELTEIRDLLARFFADRSTQRANKVWDEKKIGQKKAFDKTST